MRLDRFGVGRFEPEPAGHFDRAQKDLQDMQRPAGLEPVGMGRDAAHRVHGDRAADHGLVCFSPRKSVHS